MVRFDDGEENRVVALNNEFQFVKVDRPTDVSNRFEINEKSYKIKICAIESLRKILISNKKLELIELVAVVRDPTSNDSKIKDEGNTNT